MKLQIQLPPIEIDLGEEEVRNPQKVGAEFARWLRRFLPTWGWRKFTKQNYPQLQQTSLTMDQIKEGESWVMLKPHSGEQVSDLLMEVASLGYEREAEILARVIVGTAERVVVINEAGFGSYIGFLQNIDDKNVAHLLGPKGEDGIVAKDKVIHTGETVFVHYKAATHRAKILKIQPGKGVQVNINGEKVWLSNIGQVSGRPVSTTADSR